MYKLIDTHAHIYSESFNEDFDAMLSRAKDQSIEAIFMPNIDLSSITPMVDIHKAHPMCLPMIGLHPCHVKENYIDELKGIEKSLGDNMSVYYGIGETGIDYYWDRSFDEEQGKAFEAQIEISKSVHKPIIIHSRDSLDTTISYIRKHQDGNLKGIFHCFNGTKEQGLEIIDLGFYLGIGGVLTYKNAGVDKQIEGLPLSAMVLETDAPYLSPIPYRGKRNESSYLIHIAEKLSHVMQTTITEVADITTKNAKSIFDYYPE
ncbi:MAG: TatD family hydrolase [Saprospiraceae bacterium]